MNNLKQKLNLQLYLIKIAHEYFLRKNYSPIVSPKIVPFRDDEESHLIKVNIPNNSQNLFLSRSPQLYKEIACLYSLQGKVYEIGSVFRGEPFGEERRANEFIGIDVEMRTNKLDEITDSLKQFIMYIGENDQFRSFLSDFVDSPNIPEEIITIKYKEALNILRVDSFSQNEERCLSSYVNKNSKKNRWVILTNFPKEISGFYQSMGDMTESFDLISGWEICSGGLRRQDVDYYMSLLDNLGWSTKEMELYKTIKKENTDGNTGGYGIGLERLIGAIINRRNIAEIQPYKRVPNESILF
jgi:aspartyl/asparaginyl-tRNA synthetase